MSTTILFTIGDFEIIKDFIPAGLPKEPDELNNHIAKTLRTDNIKSYLTSLLKMENAINGRPFDEGLRITDAEIVQKLNIRENKEKLKSWIDSCKGVQNGKTCKKINLFAKNIYFENEHIELLEKLEPLCKKVRPFNDNKIILKNSYREELNEIKQESQRGKQQGGRRVKIAIVVVLILMVGISLVALKNSKATESNRIKQSPNSQEESNETKRSSAESNSLKTTSKNAKKTESNKTKQSLNSQLNSKNIVTEEKNTTK